MRAMRRQRRERGQSLAEMALLAPFLSLLIMGSAQFGALYYTKITVDTTARDAARVGSERPIGSGAFDTEGDAFTMTCIVGSTCPSSNPVIQSIVADSGELSGYTVTIAGVTATPTACDETVGDGWVSVTVAYNAPIFVPFMGSILGTGQKQVSTAVEMRVEPCTLTKGS